MCVCFAVLVWIKKEVKKVREGRKKGTTFFAVRKNNGEAPAAAAPTIKSLYSDITIEIQIDVRSYLLLLSQSLSASKVLHRTLQPS